MTRPAYDEYGELEQRGTQADLFARQVLATTAPWLPGPASGLDVLDVGSGYGHTARELARSCRTVVGLEPMSDLHTAAIGLAADVENLSFRLGGVETLEIQQEYDVVVLDNVYEHLPDQALALGRISDALRPGGVIYLLTPNKWWPIEPHYRLPFLAWLPLRMANVYLRWSGRGHDYTDASYAPSYRSLAAALNQHPELEWAMTLPGDPSATASGAPLHYRAGMAALRRMPGLWGISKALLVVARKRD